MASLKQGEQGEKGCNGVRMYGEYWGCAGVFGGSMDGTPTWNTYQLKVCTPTVVERGMGWGGDPSGGVS